MRKEIAKSAKDVEGSEITFYGIHKRFSESQHGEKLRGNARFSRYKPKHITTKEWQKIGLGADVNNMDHMLLTTGLTRFFIKHQPLESLSEEEEIILLLTAITHDWAEAVVGDEMFDLKSRGIKLEEERVYKTLLRRYLGGEIDQKILNKVFKAGTDRNTKLGKMFNAIERMGYLRTGVNAWKASKNTEDEDLKNGLQWMASNVIGNQIPTLLEYAEEYEAVEKVLLILHDGIEKILGQTVMDVFDNYPEEESEEQMYKFFKAIDIWKGMENKKIA